MIVFIKKTEPMTTEYTKSLIRTLPFIRDLRIRSLLVVNPTDRCNFSCNYCIIDKYPKKISKKDEHHYTEWVTELNRFKDTHITFTGGEPFFYDNFTELLAGLTTFGTIGIDTNLSLCDPDKLIELNKSNLDICATFHPEQYDRDIFSKKITVLLESGIRTWIHIVAIPEYFSLIEEFTSEFGDIVHPIWYMVGGEIYSYSKSDREFLMKYNARTFTLKQKDIRLCLGGFKYVHIRPNGDVYPCGTLLNRTMLLQGNIFKGYTLKPSLIRCRAQCKLYCDISFNRMPVINYLMGRIVR